MSEFGEGNIIVYLKAELVHIPDGIFMTQRCYVKQTLELFGLSDFHLVATLMIEKSKLTLDM
jgi:hypothetical protein